MLRWARTFLVIALITAILGFSGIVALSMELARIVFVVLIILFIVATLTHVLRDKTSSA